MVWHYSGLLALSDFDDVADQLLVHQAACQACPRLMILYHRGLDASGMDAEALEALLVRVKDIHARILDKCIQRTAHVCGDDLIRHAVEHYVLRVEARADDEQRVFVTEAEARSWLAAL